jgi:DNA-binding beta-propeller fold protein YncE
LCSHSYVLFFFLIGEGRFDRPAGLDYDSSGILYVVDTNNNRIQKFDTEGNFLGMWGQYGKGPGQFDNPVSLNIDPTSGYLYISDAGNKRIVIFDKSGKYIGGWGADGGNDGEFERPVSVAFGDNGRVYVVDKDRGDIQIFTNREINTVSSTRTTDSTSNSAPTTRQFSAKLSGSEEVPPTDSEASGAASFSVKDNLISYNIEVSRMDVSGAHLHEGEKNTNGYIVADLAAGEKVEGSISSSDLTGPLEGKTLKDIVELMEKGSIYVNLHSAIFPDGEIRGEVKPVKTASSSSTSIQPDILRDDT